jgi:hypothetical protein
MLEVSGEGPLPLDLGGARPPMTAGGVVVEVPDSIAIPDDSAGRFAVLEELVNQTEEPLIVVDFLG